MVAGAVVLGDGFDSTGLDDSKRLTRRQRERLADRIRSTAGAWATGLAEPGEIDRLNILRASLLASLVQVAAHDLLDLLQHPILNEGL